MSDPVKPGYCFCASFELFEQMVESVIGWQLEFRQLGPATNPYWLEQAVSRQMLYSRARFDCHFRQVGVTKYGARTFSLLARGSSDFRWCGEAVDRSCLLVMPQTGEFESVSSPGFDLHNLTLAQPLLERVAGEQFQLPLQQIIDSERVFCRNAGDALEQLRQMLETLSAQVRRASLDGGPPAPLNINRRVEETLAYLALACLARGALATPQGPRGKRMKILAAALSIIDSDKGASPSVPELVRKLGVSRRTLENAFRDGLGLSPAAYLKASRLRGLSRNLLLANPSTHSVAELVAAHGFNHQGQLAADYRRMFGELPSATLRRQA